MTRNNLEVHIAWLLSQTLPSRADGHATVQTRYSRPAEVLEANVWDQEEEVTQEPERQHTSALNRRPENAVNVGRRAEDFVRPQISSSRHPAVAYTTGGSTQQGIHQDAPMVREIQPPRSARPIGTSEYQLATPASTSVATSSSLTQSYQRFITEGTGSKTPQISRIRGDRAVNKTTRALQDLRTPQTPKPTPGQSPKPKSERVKVEAVDLTGDDYMTGMSRSSSSDLVWGEAEELWNEAAAARAEPLQRNSKKRKSDEMTALGPQKRANALKSPRRKLERKESMEGFMDIEDFEPSCHSKTTEPWTLQASVELAGHIKDDQGELEVTETVTRVETRTRKSISRVPSITEVAPLVPAYTGRIPGTPLSGSVSNHRPRSQLGLASPRIKASPSPSQIYTPRKGKSRQMKTEIQDSDEECLSDVEITASCSVKPAKFSPRPVSPSICSIPPLSLPEYMFKNAKDSKPRVGSPLRPISKNTLSRQESVPSPFQRDSPTRFVPSDKSATKAGSRHTPESSLNLDEKKLVETFLAQPASINVYRQRITNLLAENSIASMAYVDRQLTAPTHLKEERKALLEMRNAYSALEELQHRHQSIKTEKLRATGQVVEALQRDEDPSELEEQSAALTRDLRKIQADIGNLLHVSGAVKDGFGTEVPKNAVHVTSSSRIRDSQCPVPSGSGTVGSAQIIMQTQFPSFSRPDPPNPARIETDFYRASSPSHNYPTTNSVRNLDPDSPSPVRVRTPKFNENPFTIPRESTLRPQQSMRQPDFYLDPPPGEYDYDDAAFEDLLMDEVELIAGRDTSRKSVKTSQQPEDNYGDSDFDDDMENIIKDVEKRHSVPNSFTPLAIQRTDMHPAGRSISKGSTKSRSEQRKDMYSHVDVEHSGLLNHPWSRDVKRALKDRFKLAGFRHHQLEAINATLSGLDAFVLMPTGGGKSLCYQLPAVVQTGKTRGVTIVISPLLSLMHDQVRHLTNLNIRAATLNGETTAEERRSILTSLQEQYPEQHIQLLYVTPEMMSKGVQILRIFDELYKKKKMARIVIDEAHCVSQWGHDFRPDYVALSSLRVRFNDVPIMALTATATKNVITDVKHNLGMKDCPVFPQSFNRPNLYYEVRQKTKGKPQDTLDQIAKIIKEDYKGQTGIIYTLSKRGCEELSTKLWDRHRIRAYHFHAGMSAKEKNQTQGQWQTGIIQVVVATIAFGMGIDKSNVRFVIHHTIPKSLEGYYQETGRAGRDGKKSGCYLFYGYADTTMLRKFIYESDASDEQKERQRKMLQRMISYCEERAECRRVQVLNYFDERFARKDCNNTCDNCISDAQFAAVDFSGYATAAVRLVKKIMRDEVTLLHCVDVLRGAKNSKMKNNDHSSITEFGFAKSLSRGEVERLFYRLVMEDALDEQTVMKGGFPHQYMALGRNCRPYLQGTCKITMQVQISPEPGSPEKEPKSTRLPTSTMLTSPMSPSSKRKKPTKSRTIDETIEDDEYGYNQGDFIDDDDDDDEYEDDNFQRPMKNAFEHMQMSRSTPKPRQLETRAESLGPPITIDQLMGDLPTEHLECVFNFVAEAKKKEEEIRNRLSLRRPFFTETHFREMAVKWTCNLRDMENIPDINVNKVHEHGKLFIALLQKYRAIYDNTMNNKASNRPEKDIDPNHQNVIDLLSDDDDDDDEEEDDEEMEEEAKSTYFQPTSQPTKAPTQNLPWAADYVGPSASGGAKRSFASSSGGRSYSKGKSRGGARKTSYRKSNGSSSGVSKRRSSGGAARKARGAGGSLSRGSGSSKPSFRRNGGSGGGSVIGGGGGGRGIGMMPV